jgi:Xaa-Pro aminopeptidase
MSHAPTQALAHRQQIVRDTLSARGLDALVVTALPNILYLTNFAGSSAIAVLTADRVCFLTDFRYVTALADSRATAYACPGLELVTVEGSYDATLVRVLLSSGIERAGFEAAHLTVSRHNWLTAALAVARDTGQTTDVRTTPNAPELIATEGIVEAARVRKDSHEIATLREAALRLSGVANGTFEDVRRGRTERDVALAIDNRLRRAGFSKPAFDTIVAAGPNAALPHAQPGERRLTEGDLVVLDFGGVYDSYCVDLTRTVSVGPADTRAREVYNAVRNAHRLAIAAVAPGRSRFEIDAAARDTLDRYGLGEAFGHGTGHGLGIEVHEDPRISKRRPDVDARVTDEAVEAGMVFTIEPGAYLPGWGGVRIEDDVLVTEAGVEVLTDVTTELIEI